jgi:hypothetical protein
MQIFGQNSKTQGTPKSGTQMLESHFLPVVLLLSDRQTPTSLLCVLQNGALIVLKSKYYRDGFELEFSGSSKPEL